jgi:D-alanine-D-alanine ligase
MPIRRVAILYNPRPEAVAPELPDDMFEEFDSGQTITAIASVIRSLGVEPTPVIADQSFPETLQRGCYDLVFNVAEGERGRCREAIPAAILEFLKIPFTGSDAVTLGITLDKMLARRVVSPDVPVARALLFGQQGLTELHYPVIVKPNDEGSSKGIRHNAVCSEPEEAAGRARELRDRYNCSVLIEEFLQGAEITVAVSGNDVPEILGAMEIAPKDATSTRFLYSLEVKRNWREMVTYHVPPRVCESTLKLVRQYALAAYGLLGCRDIARIDFRLDATGVPTFLECNPLPGLNPESSDLVLMTRGVLSYADLVGGILRAAAGRYNMALP